MTFEEMNYKRVDIKAVIGEYEALIAQAKAAKTAKDGAEVLLKHTEIFTQADQMMALSSIRHSIDTTEEFYLKEEEFYAQSSPALGEKISSFYRAILEWAFIDELTPEFPKVFFTNAKIDTQTISPEVLPLLEKENMLVMEYQKLQGGAKIEFDGKTLNLSQISAYKDNPTREIRQKAFVAEGKFYNDNQESFDEIFDELVKIRTEIAQKLGFKNFVELGYLRMTRNCYNAADVSIFRGEVVKTIVPAVAKMKKAQAERLGVKEYKFYDDSVVKPSGNPRPNGTDSDTYNAGVSMYKELSPETNEFIEQMDAMNMFDLVAKPGKMTGGYCSYLPVYKTPFIFANFNGSSHDVEVFTHEGGHAFEAFVASKTAKLLECGSPTLEACEVHSMSMEFICWPFLEKFYGENADSARAVHLTGTLSFLPYGCMVDEFQHIVYENPELTPAQRNEKWFELETKYRPWMDYKGDDFYGRGAGWQRQIHIYSSPFYYIDYCLAQSVALQIFTLIQTNGWDAAWAKYLDYTNQGGNATFLELLKNAELINPMSSGALNDVAKSATSYLDAHGADLA